MRRNLDFIRGQTESFSGVLRDASGAVDLTSAVLTWQMGTVDGCQTKLELDETDGISVTDAANGKWTITIDPSDTSSIVPGLYIHQGEAVIGTATYNLTSGRVRLRKDLP